MRVARVHYPVTALGWGRRIGVWVQGCSIGCPGCVSVDTWDPAGGAEVAVADLLERFAALAPDGVDGVTITGGEPFEQPCELSRLIDAVREWAGQLECATDILCYSGLGLDTLRTNHAAVLDRLDALIPEPFRIEQPEGGPWRGSRNQPLVCLSPLGHARYADVVDDEPPQRRDMQVAVDGKRVWMIGIPRRGDLKRLEQSLAAQGITLEGPSWRR